jgi:hypothetical protein
LWEEDYSAVRTYLSDLKLIGADPETISSYLVQHPEVVKILSHWLKLVISIIDALSICPKTVRNPKYSPVQKSIQLILKY